MMKTTFIPASFPLPIIRRHTGTPFMGYAGATYIIQEFCNALFDSLFHILPLGTDMDKIEATPGRAATTETLAWEPGAHELMEELLEAQPVLVRISAAKQMRDRAERDARETGRNSVEASRFAELFGHSKTGATA
jgi:chlorophyllide a reductase subunit Z